jgi:hypothetical protein
MRNPSHTKAWDGQYEIFPTIAIRDCEARAIKRAHQPLIFLRSFLRPALANQFFYTRVVLTRFKV